MASETGTRTHSGRELDLGGALDLNTRYLLPIRDEVVAFINDVNWLDGLNLRFRDHVRDDVVRAEGRDELGGGGAEEVTLVVKG